MVNRLLTSEINTVLIAGACSYMQCVDITVFPRILMCQSAAATIRGRPQFERGYYTIIILVRTR